MKADWKREITRQHPGAFESLNISIEHLQDVSDWLEQQAVTHHLSYLLVHSDDGINWGVMDQGKLLTSHEALEAYDLVNCDEQTRAEVEAALTVCPSLRTTTLQQARLFASHGELLLWRDGDNQFHGRIIRDAADADQADWLESFDESQVLWGTHGIRLDGGFTLLRDGAQGLRHVVPKQMKIADGKLTVPVQLIVRHYLARENFARVVASRLTGLEVEEAK